MILPLARVLLILLSLALASCGSPAPPAVPVVPEWPELRALEQIAAEAAGHARSGSDLELLKDRTRLLEAGWAVNHQSLPDSLIDHSEVRERMSDLVNKINGLAVPQSDPARLRELVLSIEPVVAELIQLSGAR